MIKDFEAYNAVFFCSAGIIIIMSRTFHFVKVGGDLYYDWCSGCSVTSFFKIFSSFFFDSLSFLAAAYISYII